MLSFTFFAASCAILYFVVRYRVHVHVTYTNQSSSRRRSTPAAARGGASSVTPPHSPRAFGEAREGDVKEIAAALASLGVAKMQAREIAARVSGDSFDSKLRAAIQMATGRAA